MLDCSDARKLIDDSWELLASAAQLPEEWTDFFDHEGPTPLAFDDQRSYRRFYLRGKALLRRDDTLHGVYTKDVSRTGISFYCSEQLFPREQVSIWLPDGTNHRLKIARCHRVQSKCYECGATFER